MGFGSLLKGAAKGALGAIGGGGAAGMVGGAIKGALGGSASSDAGGRPSVALPSSPAGNTGYFGSHDATSGIINRMMGKMTSKGDKSPTSRPVYGRSMRGRR